MGYLTIINNIFQVNRVDIYNVNFIKISFVSVECDVSNSKMKKTQNGG